MGALPGLPTATLGGIMFNAEEAAGVGWYFDALDGWTGAPQGTLSPTQKPRQAGAWAGASFSKGRTLVLHGTMVAPTPAQATDAMDRLNTALDLGPQTLTVIENGLIRTAVVRRDGDVIPKWLSATAATFTAQMFAPDSRRLGIPLTASATLPLTSGGLAIPYTIPYTINSTVSSGLVTFTNPGNEVGPVVMTVIGPCAGPIITHQASRAALVFSSNLVLAAGETLVIDMDKHVALGNGTANRSQYITSRQWSGFDPGANTWSFSAAGFNAAAQLQVTATPAWR